MLELRNVTKYYGKAPAVIDLNLASEEGEFLVIFGPAGAGKSTTLRLIAGISPLSGGEVRFRGANLNGVAPEHRNMAMAFENYALYSHLTVRDNLAFPLRARKYSSTEIERRVKDMAEVLQITPLLARRPGFLSGGQRQRVALGRALIREADVYLLDEPISHLDAKLRHAMRAELKALCAKRESNIVYVTHDYKEAMALSDRIAVLNKGQLMQIGTPDEVYHRPANEFVASFLGDPPMSFLPADLRQQEGRGYLSCRELQIAAHRALVERCCRASPSGALRLGVRATDLQVSLRETDTCKVASEVYIVETFGYRNVVTVRLGCELVQVCTPPELRVEAKDTVWLSLDTEHVHLFSEQGEAISHPAASGVSE